MSQLLPVLAHSGRGDLPFPSWLLVYGGAFCLSLTALVLRMAWPRPRLAGAAAGRPLPRPLQAAAPVVARAGQLIGCVLLAIMTVTALWGTQSDAVNLAPLAVSVVFWAGAILVSALAGDVWPGCNPFAALARLGGSRHHPRGAESEQLGRWAAPILLFSFVWLELAYAERATPRALGIWLVAYTAAVGAGIAIWGRDWVRDGEGFAALFAAVAHLGPLASVRGEHTELRLRPPVSGLGRFAAGGSQATTVVLLVAIGGFAFDGVTGTSWWLDVSAGRAGWGLTAVNTVGLVWSVALAGLAFSATVRAARAIAGTGNEADLADALTPALVPVTVGLAVAHYFDLLVIEAQNFVALASDPAGRGWDLFGTISRSPEIIPSPAVTAVVQAVALVAGGIAALVVAHDRALAAVSPARAARIDRCMLVFVTVLTLAALALLVES